MDNIFEYVLLDNREKEKSIIINVKLFMMHILIIIKTVFHDTTTTHNHYLKLSRRL